VRLLLAGIVVMLTPELIAGSRVGVYLDFDQPASRTATAAMQKEAADALRLQGFDIAWRMVAENQGDEVFERLVVVKFTGACASEGFLRPTREILVLGTTEVSSGQVLPYSQVHCDEVRRLLPAFEFATDRSRGDVGLGRAFGRVLAHELYHVLMGTTHHSSAGLAKAIQSTDDLKSDEFFFDQTDWPVAQTSDMSSARRTAPPANRAVSP